MRFATKTELGTAMAAGAVSGAVPFGWVAGDEVYGRASKLRAACETAGKGYVLGVPCDFRVRLHPRLGKTRPDAVARLVPAAAWDMRSCGPGCKGHRDYHWAWAATASPRHWLLIRRSIPDPSDLAFFYCHAPAGRPVSLPVLIKIAGKRWPVEECHQQGKGQAGLDQHQVRLWPSFHRHTILSMCALALLAVAAAPAATRPVTAGHRRQPGQRRHPARGLGRHRGAAIQRRPEAAPAQIGMVKVSVPEARRLLHLATAPMTAAARASGHAWSQWRREHRHAPDGTTTRRDSRPPRPDQTADNKPEL